jgi:glycosyltransferase involved in cell wall biosynthesis
MLQQHGLQKLLYVITRSERGGAQQHVLELLKVSRNYFRLGLATGEDSFLASEARKLGIPVFILSHLKPPLHPLKDILALRELGELIRKVEPDLIHAHSSKAGMLSRLAAHTRGIPCIYTAHGWAFSHGAKVKRRVAAVTLEWLAGLLNGTTIAVSRYDSRLADRFHVGRAARRLTILNGLPDNSNRANPGEGDSPVILMVARFAPPKDQLALLYGLSWIQMPFRIWFAGDGPLLRQARLYASALGMSHRTTFLGTKEDVPELLSRVNIFALISRHEGLPISILEAMRAGLPILASNVGGIPETVQHGVNGFLVEPGNSDALTRAAESLLSQPDLRMAMGKESRNKFVEQFHVETMAEQTLAAYQFALEPQEIPAGYVEERQHLALPGTAAKV